ncbi:hypothetical protein HQ535_07670 [bacterium]|nr:hypothetical protein [bacterium]
MRKIWKPLVTAVVVGAMVFSGIAFAQTEEETPVTESPGYERLVEVMQDLIDNGTITIDQAEAVAEFLVENRPPRGERGPGGHIRRGVAEAAEYLGLEVSDVADALRDGQTLADIAVENGSSADALVTYLVGLAEDHLQEKVDAGDLTTEEMAERLAEAGDRITDMVNGELPERPEGPGGRGPGGRGFGPGPETGGESA